MLKGRVGHNTQFAGPRAADGLSAPHGETLLPFPPQPENITERARGQEGWRGVGGWVRTSSRDKQINTSCIKHTRSGKASALGVPREEVLGVKVLCAPGPAVQGRRARAPSPAVPAVRPTSSLLVLNCPLVSRKSSLRAVPNQCLELYPKLLRILFSSYRISLEIS